MATVPTTKNQHSLISTQTRVIPSALVYETSTANSGIELADEPSSIEPRPGIDRVTVSCRIFVSPGLEGERRIELLLLELGTQRSELIQVDCMARDSIIKVLET